jgi:hypothetical protein
LLFIVSRSEVGTRASRACPACQCLAIGSVVPSVRVRLESCFVIGCTSAPRSGFATMCEMHYGRRRRGVPLEDDSKLNATGTCQQCGGGLPDRHRKLRRYCSERCRTRASRGVDEQQQHACIGCGGVIPRSHRRDKLYCSKACQDRASHARRHPPPHPKTCRVCGRSIKQPKVGRPAWWCSRQCRNVAARKARRPLSCKDCGADVPWPRRTYCSNSCQWRAGHTRRAARLALSGVGYGRRKFSIRYVGDRDGWICHICREPVDPLVPREASIDHLIPLSAGGLNRAENVALAHLSCNSRRGPGLIPAQLRLIG